MTLKETKYSGEEKRRFKRLNKQFVVRIQLRGISTKWDMVLIKDVSKGGLSFRYDHELKVGQELNLKINIALNEKAIECRGKIVRVNPSKTRQVFEAGVSFTNIASVDGDIIELTVEELLLGKKKT